MAYPMLAEHLLPPVAKGLFFTGLLATIMSTLNTLAFVSGTTLGRDLVMRLRRQGRFAVSRRATDRINDQIITGVDQQTETARDHSAKNGADDPAERRWVQAGLLVSALLAVVLALSIPSVIKLWYTIGTVIVPGLLIPLVSTYFPSLRIGARAGFSVMLAGWLTSTVWLLAGWTRELGVTEYYPFGIEPMYPGLAVSVVLWAWGRLTRS
jgi:SSS family solute:Na+ symporter